MAGGGNSRGMPEREDRDDWPEDAPVPDREVVDDVTTGLRRHFVASGDGLDVVNVDDQNIQGEFVRVSADMAYHGQLFADAVREFLLAKARYKSATAAAELRIRATNLVQWGGAAVKLTEASVAAAVVVDVGVDAAQLAMIEAEAAKARRWAYLEAIRSKRDMLVSLGAHVRAFMDPVIREKERERRERLPVGDEIP